MLLTGGWGWWLINKSIYPSTDFPHVLPPSLPSHTHGRNYTITQQSSPSTHPYTAPRAPPCPPASRRTPSPRLLSSVAVCVCQGRGGGRQHVRPPINSTGQEQQQRRRLSIYKDAMTTYLGLALHAGVGAQEGCGGVGCSVGEGELNDDDDCGVGWGQHEARRRRPFGLPVDPRPSHPDGTGSIGIGAVHRRTQPNLTQPNPQPQVRMQAGRQAGSHPIHVRVWKAAPRPARDRQSRAVFILYPVGRCVGIDGWILVDESRRQCTINARARGGRHAAVSSTQAARRPVQARLPWLAFGRPPSIPRARSRRPPGGPQAKMGWWHVDWRPGIERGRPASRPTRQGIYWVGTGGRVAACLG